MHSRIIPLYFLSLILIFVVINVSNTIATGSDIRNIDFKNFTYDTSYCYDQFKDDGLDKSITVHNGEFKTGNGLVYFNIGTSFIYNKPGIIYGDLMANGHEEAIVAAQCGSFGANYSLREIFVYTMNNGKPRLIATIDDGGVEKDFARYYPSSSSSTNMDNFYWGISSIGIKNGKLEVRALVDGCHACMHSTAIIRYKLSGDRLIPVGRPQKIKRATP